MKKWQQIVIKILWSIAAAALILLFVVSWKAKSEKLLTYIQIELVGERAEALFMDEIGETPLATQARLLRVLENAELIRVGSSKVQKTDVRVIAATNKDLLLATHNNKFREDLYYRLNTVPIRVPSLRERKEDIIILFRKFAVDFA